MRWSSSAAWCAPEDLLPALRGAGLAVLATTGDARADDLLSDPPSSPVALLFGNEAHGLPEDLLAAADRRVRIPIVGRAESLNLATAAAVALYVVAQAQGALGATPGG
jgi:TrmH family RNA methyltransferase